MRIVSYLIDDKKDFTVYYTLKEDKDEISYQLEDLKGNKLNIEDLNGYEKTYIHKCSNNFYVGKEITEEYKNFITILNKPRIIKPSINLRYKLFKEYAKANRIKESSYNYIKFIDRFSNEFESIYNKSILEKQKEFDNFIKDKISIIINKEENKQNTENIYDNLFCENVEEGVINANNTEDSEECL